MTTDTVPILLTSALIAATVSVSTATLLTSFVVALGLAVLVMTHPDTLE